ncbi:NAD-dependent epimerase/dehydratase family protein [Fulvivirga sp. 29W222]|uniref:NAD-dependent epimerase/dehydratase family protein n=1 Tax=Fulvivirga marina TaxID=2494733 RepID=A0A937FT32_9BACT|nr:NAD-dependent epimerase/dehydratase family protein [Fulvivirga marina]MBL6444834.1 NAD-dependent epimerase/dehydratase family protein [Fulvivirga marina]
MILVTGANGFLGSYICRKLLKEQFPFIAMVRPSSDLSLLEDILENITIHEGDILDTESFTTVLEEVDDIIHCAAIVSYNAKDRQKMNEVNIAGTRNIVNLALTNPNKYFIHVSSVAALGRNKHSGRVDENNKWENSKWNTSYGESKYLAELEVWRAIMEGLNAVIINPSVILGPGNWDKSSAKLFKYVWNEKPFYTSGVLNYVDVRDVADIVFKLLNKRVSGERYIINADNIPIKDFFEKIASAFNKKAPRIKANGFLLKLARMSQSIKSLFTGSSPTITRETARVGDSKIYFDNSKIKSELNHNFVTLSNTINWTCEFYLKKNLTKN